MDISKCQKYNAMQIPSLTSNFAYIEVNMPVPRAPM